MVEIREETGTWYSNKHPPHLPGNNNDDRYITDQTFAACLTNSKRGEGYVCDQPFFMSFPSSWRPLTNTTCRKRGVIVS